MLRCNMVCVYNKTAAVYVTAKFTVHKDGIAVLTLDPGHLEEAL